jgi:hypothetical protein
MYIGCESFAAVCAYLEGFDRARDNGSLAGFHPWMVLRQNSGHVNGWSILVLFEALGTMPGCDIADLSTEQNRICIRKLDHLLREFFEDRKQRTPAGIFHDYTKWLRRKRLA